MKLIADWGVEMERLDRLLDRGCLNCASDLGQLVRHEVSSGAQVWLSCCSCGSRLEGPLLHRERPENSRSIRSGAKAAATICCPGRSSRRRGRCRSSRSCERCSRTPIRCSPTPTPSPGVICSS